MTKNDKYISKEDCISRQAVLDLMQIKMGGKELYEAINELPPVTPERPKGEWIPTDFNKYPETYPKPYQEVWETDSYGKVIHRAYGGERNIIAWMPYIEPQAYSRHERGE